MSQSCLQQQRDAAAAASYPYMFHHDPLALSSYGRSCGASQSNAAAAAHMSNYGSSLGTGSATGGSSQGKISFRKV